MSLRQRARLLLLPLLAAVSASTHAASCAVVDAVGAVTVTATPVAECTGFVLLDAGEYSEMPTLSSLFAVPLASDLQSMWMAGFSLPLIVYLVAWAYQTVINFATKP